MKMFENKLIRQAKENKKRDVRQGQLKTRLDIKDREEVVVHETTNMSKFLIKTTGTIIRLLATITLYTFAFIGIIGVIYSGSRNELILILNQFLKDILSLI